MGVEGLEVEIAITIQTKNLRRRHLTKPTEICGIARRIFRRKQNTEEESFTRQTNSVGDVKKFK